MSSQIEGAEKSRLSPALWPALVGAAAISIGFYLHFRFVLAHFSNDGYLLDSGWFAHLIASADPWLRNPRSIGDTSFYNHHISPFLFLFGAPLRWVGLDRFAIFALHQGVMNAVMIAAMISLASPSLLSRWILLGVVAAIAMFGDMVWQLAGYPHIEIATIALCTVGFAFHQRRMFVAAAGAYGLALLVREDGGLFVALFLIAAAALRMRAPTDWRTLLTSRELPFAVVAVAFSVLMFWLKAAHFPGFPTFSSNYSGENWSHVSLSLVAARIAELSTNPPILLTVLAASALGLFSWRYLIVPALVSPLLIAQLLAIRDVIGLFRLHYIIPWLVIWIGFVLAASYRAKRGEFGRFEAGLLLVFAILASAPVTAALRQPSSIYALRFATTGEVADLQALANKLETEIAHDDPGGACLSIGAVAIVPDAVLPQQVVGPDSDMTGCTRLYLMRGDMDYRRIRQILDAGKYPLLREIENRIEVYHAVR